MTSSDDDAISSPAQTNRETIPYIRTARQELTSKNRIDERKPFGYSRDMTAKAHSATFNSARRPAFDPTDIGESLFALGYARLGNVMDPGECATIRALYDDAALFRSRIDMARYRFGRGEYQYFAYPLPVLVQDLRETFYATLAGIANDWAMALGQVGGYPNRLEGYLELCHERGQVRPTPLVLRYRAGDFNCLHQDLYGDLAFPFQVVICLSKPDEEFTGGELLLVEQQPRAQSVGHAIRLDQGEAAVISNRYRPVKGARGYYRTNLRHGVSRLLTGERYALGLIFHDAA